MFSILDGRSFFYQWDTDRKLIVNDKNIKQVHFTNQVINNALVCEAYELDGAWVVNVPNLLLQDNLDITAYAFGDNHTKYEKVIEVKSKSKPDDYIYTETETLTWESLAGRIEELEKNGGGSGANIEVDKTYNRESENAQSGKAVAEACASTFNYAKEYTDRNKVVVSHEYIPSSGQAMSGIAVSEALKTIKGLVNLGYIYTSTDFANCQFEKGYLYIFTLAAGTRGVKCNNFNFGELTAIHCIGVFDGNYFDFIAPGYGHFYTQQLNGTFTVINLPEAELSTSSLNPVQNKVITQAINEINSQLDGLEALLANI